VQIHLVKFGFFRDFIEELHDKDENIFVDFGHFRAYLFKFCASFVDRRIRQVSKPTV
jgi:hypothetical protein